MSIYICARQIISAKETPETLLQLKKRGMAKFDGAVYILTWPNTSLTKVEMCHRITTCA